MINLRNQAFYYISFNISGNNRGDDETDRQSVSDFQTSNDKIF